MSARLDEEIGRSRRIIADHEANGRAVESSHESERLKGLLIARTLTDNGFKSFNAPCLHPTHESAGFDENQRTVWRCTACRTIA